MTISMYQASVPRLVNALNNLSHVLGKAQAHIEAKKLDPKTLLEFRLFPDMLHMTRQVQIASDTATGVVARLAAAVSAAIASNDLSEKLKAQGVDVIGNTPAQFNTYIRQEIFKWAKVIQAAGINAGAVH